MKKTSFQPLPLLYSDSPGGAAIARWPSHQQGFLGIITTLQHCSRYTKSNKSVLTVD